MINHSVPAIGDFQPDEAHVHMIRVIVAPSYSM